MPIANVEGDTGALCPWIDAGTLDPAALAFTGPMIFSVDANRVTIHAQHLHPTGERGRTWVRLDLTFYETEQLKALLNSQVR